ncbi:MAG: S-adenosyl-l-methionine hydroxide adenosyltransferase family protein [Chitinophagaceae bacterium]|nr:S-adenosyl-l-methionine hydroxide adenosyltransferase family protein [Chitinophagaceae bacterium]
MKTLFIGLYLLLSTAMAAIAQNNMLVFQTDFGLKDGAVAAMKGVAVSVSPKLALYDLTHEIPPYNIWEAAYRLYQTAPYWPAGTVFVSVVDPGVGSERKSVVVKTRTGHFFVGPDNGQFTLIAESMGIAAVYEIDEAINRRKDSKTSYTFHGRDVYAYTGARLAAGIIRETDIGKKLPGNVIHIAYQKPVYKDGQISGNIPILDIQYGNIWTNIDTTTFNRLGVKPGELVKISILDNKEIVYTGIIPYVSTFSAVAEGSPLAYLNSLLQLSFALNMGSFAEKYKIGSGPGWTVILSKSSGQQ